GPHRPLRACLPFARTRRRQRAGGRRAGADRQRGRGDPRARDALQRRTRAELLQRAAGGRARRRTRAAHRTCDRLAGAVRRHARGGARDEAADPRGGGRERAMIHGVGTDIVLVERIEALLARWGERFARRVLGDQELAEYRRRRGKGGHGSAYATRYLAKRFAAKEAFGKALGVGLHAPMTLHSLQVLNDARGRPVAVARNALERHLEENGLVAHVSLSDERDSALAFVMIERRETR